MRLSMPLLIGLVLATTAGPARAAQVTWADRAGSCGGHSPCFTSVGDAVATAGPAPAQVFVFPGTYPETVDLGTMGSAIGEAPGDLSVVSVDAAGRPAPGAVIDPEAPGGPGIGSAVHAGDFPGALVLDGLVVRAFADVAILMFGGTGPVRLSRITATSGLAHGVAVSNASGDLRLEASSAIDSGLHGFVLETYAGTVTVEDSLAEGNGDNGISVHGTAVSVFDSRAEANGSRGFLITSTIAAGTAVVENVEAIGNGDHGIEISRVFSGEDFAAASVRSVVANSNGAGGVRVDSNGAIAVSDVTAIANGETGIALAGGSVHLSGASAAANDGYGLALFDAGRATVAGRAASARSELGGVRAQASPLGGPPPLRVTVLASRFEGNALGSIELQPRAGAEVRIGCSDFLANGPAGLTLLADLTVDARSNFWGDPSGPDHPGNPGGTGDVIRDAAAGLAGTVLYQPFLPAPSSAADCPVEGAIEIPALDRVGLTVLALLIASGALGLLGRGRRAG